jgi:hypothetical protein
MMQIAKKGGVGGIGIAGNCAPGGTGNPSNLGFGTTLGTATRPVGAPG